MLFSSITFLVAFLPLVLIAYYYATTITVKNTILLFASLLFYSWGEPKYVFVMILSILINYRCGLFVSDTNFSLKNRKLMLAVSILINLSFLFVFKYLGFFSKILNAVFSRLNFPSIPVKELIMPIGISFYTFQAISYLIDIYRKPALVQKNLFNLGLYITFFPQLIAGPIVRYHDINNQILLRKSSLNDFVYGVERFIIGLGKKVLLANTFAVVADGIYNLPFEQYDAYYAWIAIIAYSLQIFYDFSGYSDMAIGLGKMFGFTFLENFNYPYMAQSITDFWRRWHISLSSWFKDYVYIPLGGNRKGKFRTSINLYVVFLLTGIWHGAAFSFIVWGLGHGTLLFLEKTI
ncbi:MAG: MBOAT family O-acyltransferase, partial [Treponemataceae bacterium]